MRIHITHHRRAQVRRPLSLVGAGRSSPRAHVAFGDTPISALMVASTPNYLDRTAPAPLHRRVGQGHPSVGSSARSSRPPRRSACADLRRPVLVRRSSPLIVARPGDSAVAGAQAARREARDADRRLHPRARELDEDGAEPRRGPARRPAASSRTRRRRRSSCVVKEMRVGNTLEQSLVNMSARIGSRTIDSALSAVLIGLQVGGNLPDGPRDDGGDASAR